MLNKKERMNKLNAMGANTSKYFTIPLENGGSVTVIIDENGNPVKVNDTIATQIIEDGYVRNTKLHRRFVMAQMFQGLNYVSWDKKRTGYKEWLKNFGIKYAFDMMLEEIRVLGKLEERDRDTFVERAHFFTKDVIMKTMEDYVAELKKHIDAMPSFANALASAGMGTMFLLEKIPCMRMTIGHLSLSSLKSSSEYTSASSKTSSLT